MQHIHIYIYTNQKQKQCSTHTQDLLDNEIGFFVIIVPATAIPVIVRAQWMAMLLVRIIEKKMETTTVYWGFIGIMENQMETTIVYWGFIGLVFCWLGLGFRVVLANIGVAKKMEIAVLFGLVQVLL